MTTEVNTTFENFRNAFGNRPEIVRKRNSNLSGALFRKISRVFEHWSALVHHRGESFRCSGKISIFSNRFFEKRPVSNVTLGGSGK